jgi:hypothetical protein
LCSEGGQLGFYYRDFLLVFGITFRNLGSFLGLQSLGFVQIVTPYGGIRQYRNHLGLNFKDPSGHKDELFFSHTGHLDSNGAGIDAGDERCVLGIDAEFAYFAWKYDEFRFPREDLLFGADNIHMYGIGHGVQVRAVIEAA